MSCLTAVSESASSSMKLASLARRSAAKLLATPFIPCAAVRACVNRRSNLTPYWSGPLGADRLAFSN